MSQARPVHPPKGYHVRPEGAGWRAVTRYATWVAPTLRPCYADALRDAQAHSHQEEYKARCALS